VRKSQYQNIVATHEAGHAVIARLLGVGIKQALVVAGSQLVMMPESSSQRARLSKPKARLTIVRHFELI
jgi:hypothetical protein